jgi:hypothetical protein
MIGCIMQACYHVDQIAFARTCKRAKRVFVQFAQKNKHSITDYACTHDEVGLFKLTYREIEMELYWIRVVEVCSIQIMAYLLRRCNPNWNKCYALYRLVRSKHKNAIPALLTLLADPMTHEMPSLAIDVATHSSQVSVLKILINDGRFMAGYPEIGWKAAISHNLGTATREMVAKYPQYCDHYIPYAINQDRLQFVQQMLPHLSLTVLQKLCNNPTVPYHVMKLLRNEFIKRM